MKKWTKTLSKGHFTALGSCIQESNVWSKASWGALFSYHHPTDDGEWQITCQPQHTRQGARLPGVLSFLAPAKALLRMKEWFINSSHWSQSIIEAADQPGLYSGCSRWCLCALYVQVLQTEPARIMSQSYSLPSCHLSLQEKENLLWAHLASLPSFPFSFPLTW